MSPLSVVLFHAAKRPARLEGALFAGVLLTATAVAQGDATNGPPVITSPPEARTAYENDLAFFRVTATGATPLSYQWLHSGTNLAGATNATFTITAVTTNDAGPYRVTVTNALGSVTSEAATLTVLPNVPRILQQPESQTVIAGAAVVLNADVRGATPLTHTWTKDGVVLTNVLGSLIIFTSVTNTDAGQYQLTLSNRLGVVTSEVARLVVKPNTPRQLTTGQPALEAGERLRVPIRFAAQGNENLLSFSLAFNTNTLAELVSAELTAEAAQAAPGAALAVDQSQLAEGRIAFQVALPVGNVMRTQAFHLADIVMAVLPGLGDRGLAEAGLDFGSVPGALLARDTNAVVLPVLDFVTPVVQTGAMSPRPEAQSGLFLQTLTLINPGALKMTGLDVLVRGLTNDSLGKPMRVHNAIDATNGIPVVYGGTFLPADARELTVEFHVPDRKTLPAPQYEARIVPRRSFDSTTGQAFELTTRVTNGWFLVEFLTSTNRVYFVQYTEAIKEAPELTVWKTAVPGILGTGSRVQWIDRGPPRTETPPGTNRFYRGVLAPR